MVFAVIAAASGQQFILTGQWSMQGNSEAVISSARNGQVMHLGGIGTEMRFSHVGFGSTFLVNMAEAAEDEWLVNGDIRVFLSYHFFRDRAFLDPFIQAGGGAYGAVTVHGDACYGDVWVDEEEITVGFYPFLAAGLGLRFRGGLYASGQFNWRPVVGSVPCCETIGTPGIREYEVVFALGYSFGGRR